MWYDTTLGAHYNYNSTEAQANAWEVYNYFRGLSTPWAVESIAALCGNMSVESFFNPYIRETTQTGAFGLCQWITNKSTMINWANNRGLRPTSGTAQVQYIEAERIGGVDNQYLARGDYSTVSFSDFAYNTENRTVSDLARCWWNNYERSAEYQTSRGTRAVYYYNMFGGTPPTPGTFPIWLIPILKRAWWKPGGRKYITT